MPRSARWILSSSGGECDSLPDPPLPAAIAGIFPGLKVLNLSVPGSRCGRNFLTRRKTWVHSWVRLQRQFRSIYVEYANFCKKANQLSTMRLRNARRQLVSQTVSMFWRWELIPSFNRFSFHFMTSNGVISSRYFPLDAGSHWQFILLCSLM